jgi:hypothetical protein
MNNTFLLFLFFQIISGQTFKGKEIHGIIHVDSVSVESVNIVNETTEKSTSSDKNGFFFLLVKEGDILIFSAVNLVTLRKKINSEDLAKDIISIHMVTENIALKEVIINENPQITAEKLGIVPFGQKKYSPAERKLYTARSGLLDRPLNWMSGRTARLKKEVAVEYKEQLLLRLSCLFEDKYYTQTLKIPHEYIRGFQYYCIENMGFVAALNSKNKTLSMFLIINLAKEFNKITDYEN